ncbi:MAG: RHS repeat domain-containing protein [Candidatus Methylacidiphilales bacterium]
MHLTNFHFYNPKNYFYSKPIKGLRGYELGYRFAFNGKEKDNETYGEGNAYDFGARIYDSRLGRWLAVDPLMSKYPFFSPFNYCANNPMVFVDPDGKKIVDSKGKEVKVTITKNDDGTIKEIIYEFAKGTTKEVKEQFNANAGVIFTELGKTKTGTEQIEKARDSKYKEAFELNNGLNTDDHRVEDGRTKGTNMGWTSYIYIKGPDGKFKIDEKATITHIVYVGTIKKQMNTEGSTQSNYTLNQNIAATAGHEIEHATEKNLKMSMDKKNDPDGKLFHGSVEKDPNKIGNQIRNEYKK